MIQIVLEHQVTSALAAHWSSDTRAYDYKTTTCFTVLPIEIRF